MNNQTKVNGKYLIELHNILDKKGLDIEDVKNEILLPTLNELNMYLTNKQINQTDKIKNIKTRISEVEKEIKHLSKTLQNKIIPAYEETSQSIKKHFNIDFHEDMDNFLKIINEK